MEVKYFKSHGFNIPIKSYKKKKDACLEFMRDFYEANGMVTIFSLLKNKELKKNKDKYIKPVAIFKKGLALYFVLPNGTEHLAVYIGMGKVVSLHNYEPVVMPIWKIKKFIKGGYYVGDC